MYRPRLIVWLLVIALILGFGWYKSFENRRDRERQAAWGEQIAEFTDEGWRECDRLAQWLQTLCSESDARQQIEAELNDGRPFELEPDGLRQRATWTDPDYGIELNLTFLGDKLLERGMQWGSDRLMALHPQPPSSSRTGPAESVRQFVVRWAWALWLVALAPAAGVRSRREGLIAAEVMLALALAVGTALVAAPQYSLTLRGIFSNNPLFFAAIMYLTSVVSLAFRLAPRLGPEYRPLRLQFGIRSLLVLTTAVAVLLGMGRFGYVALCTFGIGAVLFFFVLRARLASPVAD